MLPVRGGVDAGIGRYTIGKSGKVTSDANKCYYSFDGEKHNPE